MYRLVRLGWKTKDVADHFEVSVQTVHRAVRAERSKPRTAVPAGIHNPQDATAARSVA